MTVWLTGMLAIASAIMCIGLWPIVKSELRAEDVVWWRNKALRVSGALYIHGAGAVILFATIPLSSNGLMVGVSAYLLWAVLGLWLLAKTLVISVSGRLRFSLLAFAIWTAGCAFYSLMGWV